MPDRFLLAYFFATFAVGIACLGTVIVVARRRGDELARAFLFFYSALSIFVTTGLLNVFVATLQDVQLSTVFVFEYLESFVGRYGVMFTLPFFAHRVFAVKSRRRDRHLLILILAAVASQHVTEYLLGGIWDDRGDVAEDVLFAGVLAYTVWIGVTRLNESQVDRPLAIRFLILMAAAVPGSVHDLFLGGDAGWRWYPLWYCLFSVAGTVYFVGRELSPSGGAIPPGWDLSGREAEVIRLVQRGLSNKEIAHALFISPNTVKTHMRAVFDKSGVRTRLGLMAALGSGRQKAEEADPESSL